MTEGAGAVKCWRDAFSDLADNPALTDFDSRIFFALLAEVRTNNLIQPFTVTGLAEELRCSRSGLARSLKRLQEQGVITRDDPNGLYRMNPDIAEYVPPEELPQT